jgi:uncharacterized membrane protein
MRKPGTASPPVPRPVSTGLLTLFLVLHLLALVLAIGPAVFFGAAVAPAAFRVLPTRDLAASLTAPILTVACWLAEASFVVLFATSLLIARAYEPPPLWRALMTRASVLGIIAAVVIEKLLIPPIEKIRAETVGLIDRLPANDPSRILLGRYHRLATGFFAGEIAAALLILLLTARTLARGRQRRQIGASRPPVPKLLDLSDA